MNATQVFYQCQRCGNCCRWPGTVKITEKDLDQLAEFFQISPSEFVEKYTHLAENRQGLVLKNKPDESCIFLSGENHCQVQAAKPEQCQGFPNKWNFPGWREMCEAIEIPRT